MNKRTVLISIFSGFAWGLVALLLAARAMGSSIWPGVLASPAIGAIVGLGSWKFRNLPTWGRLLVALVALYVAAALFGLAVGLHDFVVDARRSGVHRIEVENVFQSVLALVWGLTMTGYVLFLWPLAYFNFMFLWRQGTEEDWMKGVRTGIVLLSFLAAVPPAFAVEHSKSSRQDRQAEERRRPESDVRALLRLEDDWAKGLEPRDGALFNRLLAKGFVYTENDHTMGRDALLRQLTRGSDRVTEAHNEGMRVHPFGDTAVVTGWLVVRGRGSNGPFHRRYRFTDTWARPGGDWQIVAAHDYLEPEAKR